MSDYACPLPHRHDPDRPRSSEDGIYLCRGCFAGLEQALAEMPAHFDALARRLVPQGGRGPQVSGTREKALPIDPTVAEHRGDIRGKLASWALMVAEERGITAPRSPDVSVTATWLLVHLRWACAQPWIDEFAAEMVGCWAEREGQTVWMPGLRGRSMSLLYPTGRRRVEVGKCVEPDCNGALTATIAPADDLLPSAITCSHDFEHTWEASRWMALGRRIFGAEAITAAGAANFAQGHRPRPSSMVDKSAGDLT